jgi:hypothetical protein
MDLEQIAGFNINMPCVLLSAPSKLTHLGICLCMQDAARRAQQAAVAEDKRRAVHEAAERHREEVKKKLEAKLARVKPRYVSRCAAGNAQHHDFSSLYFQSLDSIF